MTPMLRSTAALPADHSSRALPRPARQPAKPATPWSLGRAFRALLGPSATRVGAAAQRRSGAGTGSGAGSGAGSGTGQRPGVGVDHREGQAMHRIRRAAALGGGPGLR
ncbi:hypothetical protein [Citricoccus sp.]|uniref:hypothetical protein n=1 Tax=Citricoccus sp. TaxID=1978372 RepID=UPI002618B746|nr:hypothetical protein [Citricoccus sp.]HRO31009.1 hypothetical protein [Citricoccus sp.]